MATGKQGNIPTKTEAQRKRIRARAAVRRYGTSYRPNVAKGGKRDAR